MDHHLQLTGHKSGRGWWASLSGVAVAIAAATLIACSSSPSAEPNEQDGRRERISNGEHEGLRYEFGLSRGRQIAADEATSPVIRDAVSDGVLTFAEYESAVLNMIACVEEQGAFVRESDPALSSRGLYTWLIGWPNERGDLSSQVLSCTANELGILDLLWKEFLAPSEEEVRAGMREMADCLRSSGLGDLVPDSLAPSDFQRIQVQLAVSGRDSEIPTYRTCAKSVQAEFGLIGFVEEGVD